MAGNPSQYVYGPSNILHGLQGATVPNVGLDPSTSIWTLLGIAGSDDYAEEGVSITFEQTIATVKGSSNPNPRAARRTEAGVMVKVKVRDMNVGPFGHMLNGNPPVNTPAASGTAGFDRVALQQGLEVHQFALLVRLPDSPVNHEWNSQFYFPRMFVDSVSDIQFGMDEPAGLEITYKGLLDSTDGMGYYDVQTAAAL